MPNYTTNLNLFKYDTQRDGKEVFSIDKALNENWDKIDNGLKTSAGHMVGEFVAFAVSTKYTPEGFVKADNTEYTQAMFPDLWQYYLHPIDIGGEQITLLDVCTYDAQRRQIEADGASPKWAVDDVRKTFKVPFIPDGYYFKEGSGTANKAGLPNINGTLDMRTLGYNSTKDKDYSGALYVRTGKYAGPSGAGDKSNEFIFDASRSNPIYGRSETVDTNAIAVQWFVYVANAQIGESSIDWSRYMEGLQGIKNDILQKDLSNTTTKLADTFLLKLMPDYSAGIALAKNNSTATHTGFIYVNSMNNVVGFDFKIKNMSYRLDGHYHTSESVLLPIYKGDAYSCSSWGSVQSVVFYPLKGAQ